MKKFIITLIIALAILTAAIATDVIQPIESPVSYRVEIERAHEGTPIDLGIVDSVDGIGRHMKTQIASHDLYHETQEFPYRGPLATGVIVLKREFSGNEAFWDVWQEFNKEEQVQPQSDYRKSFFHSYILRVHLLDANEDVVETFTFYSVVPRSWELRHARTGAQAPEEVIVFAFGSLRWGDEGQETFIVSDDFQIYNPDIVEPPVFDDLIAKEPKEDSEVIGARDYQVYVPEEEEPLVTTTTIGTQGTDEVDTVAITGKVVAAEPKKVVVKSKGSSVKTVQRSLN